MKRIRRAAALAILVLVVQANAAAPELAVASALKATGLIDSIGRPNSPQEWYLAVCVHPDGYFLTVSEPGKPINYAPRKLVLNPGRGEGQQIASAWVYHADPERGIVVIKAEGISRWPAVRLAQANVPAAEWTMLSYVLRPVGSRFPAEYLPVEAIKRTRDKPVPVDRVALIHVDDRKGAPLLDDDGKLAGIIGFKGHACTAPDLRALLATPQPKLSPRCILLSDLHTAREFTIAVPALLPDSPKYMLQVSLDDGTGTRFFVARPSGVPGQYSFSTTPASERATKVCAIECRIAALQEGKQVSETRETIAVAESPPILEPPLRRQLSKDPLEIELPMGKGADDVIPAGGGRFLLFYTKSLKELAVLDLNKHKIDAFLPIDSEDALVVGGATKFCIVRRDRGQIDRYDLATLDRDLTMKLPDDRPVLSASMGHASEGPVLLLVQDPAPDRRLHPRLIDLITLRPIPAQFFSPDQWSMPYEPQLRAFADGSSFFAWRANDRYRMTPMGGLIEGRCNRWDGGVLLPGADQTSIYAGHRVLDPEFRIIESVGEDSFLLPTYNPSFHLSLRVAKLGMPGRGFRGEFTSIAFRSRQCPVPLLEREPYPELPVPAGARDAALTVDKRVHFLPQADLLVTVNQEGNKIVLRRIEVCDLMARANVDYLLVDSVPALLAFRGHHWEYEPHIRSRKGNVQVIVQEGPRGMELKNGKVQWELPVSLPEDEVRVSLLIKDAGGQEIRHAFRVQVR